MVHTFNKVSHKHMHSFVCVEHIWFEENWKDYGNLSFFKFSFVTSDGFWGMNLNEASNFISMTLRRQWVLLLHINDGSSGEERLIATVLPHISVWEWLQDHIRQICSVSISDGAQTSCQRSSAFVNSYMFL